MLEIECLWECNDGLGETPIWVAEESSIYWADHVGPAINLTDSRRSSLRRLNITTGERKTWDMPEQIGSFGFRADGGVIGAANSGFCGINLETADFEEVFDPEPSKPNNRLNDGKIDRRGRFWCSSMNTQLTDKSAHIYCLQPDMTCHKAAKDFSFVVGNGIAFDPDDTRMYFGDTFGGMIYVFDFDIDEGHIYNRRPFYSVACHAISTSNQIDREPRCFSAVLYEGQFLVLYVVGDQLLMPSSYHAGFTE